ncbi:MAG: DNA/RNA non-specific endonuclease [Alistipes sp.]|nr:DNA/RNA non-specific endonuclease [Alistipes sp.]
MKFIALHYVSGDFTNKVLAISQEANEQATEPEVIFSDNFDKIVAEKDANNYWPYLDAKYMNPQGSAAEGVTYSTSEGNITLRANSTSNSDYSDYEGSGSNNIFFGMTPNKFVIENIALPAKKDCYVLTFGAEKYNQQTGSTFDSKEFHVYISGDNTKWSELSYAFAEGDNLEGRWNDATASFKLAAVPEKLYIKFVADAASSYRLDDVALATGGEGAQTIDLAQGTEEETPGQGGDNEGEEVPSASTIKIDFTVAANYPAEFPVASANKIVDRTEYTFGGHKFAFAGSTGAGFYQVTGKEIYVLFGKKGAYVELPAIEGKSLIKVVATSRSGASGSVMVGVRDAAGSDVDGGTPIKWEQVAPYTYTYELNGTTANTSYYLYVNSAHNAQLTSLELYYTDGNNDNPGEGEEGGEVTPEIKEMTIAEVIAAAADTQFKLKESTVVAVSKKGLMLYDGKNYIYAYAGSQPEVAVGDKVTVEGKKGSYNNMPQVSSPVITKTGTNSSFAHPTAVEMNGAVVDAFQNDVKIQYVKVAGKLTISGGRYYNLAVEGATAQGSLDNPLDAICPADYDGKSLIVYGYTLYTTSSNKYVNIITTAVEVVDSGDNEGGDEGEDDGGDEPGYTGDADISIDFTVAANYPAGFPVASANKIVDRTEYTFGGHKFALAGSTGAGFYQVSGSEPYVLFGKQGAYIEFPAIEGKTLKKVVATSRKGASATVEVGVTDTNGNAVNGGAAIVWAQTEPYTFTYELTGTAANTAYRLTVANAKNAQLTRLELYYTDGSGQSGNQGSGSTGDSDNQGSTSQTPVAGVISKAWAELPVCDQRDNIDYRYYISSVGSKSNVRNYTMCYDRTKKAALWVAYPLHALYTSGDVGRTEDWAYEPSIPSQYQAYLNKSYAGSYDRGHQIPSGDRQSSQEMNQQTFYYTNMTPQASSLNQSMWNNLETKVRNEICSDTLYVVTGAHFGGTRHSSIAASTTDNNGQECPTPTHYYKALLRTVSGNTGKMISEIKDASQIQAIGIYVQHQDTTDSTIKNEHYISIKELESITGFNFFAMLDDSIESAVKAQCNPSAWF